MMDLKFLTNIEPWQWPEDAGRVILEVLADGGAEASDRLLAAEMAGEIVVINDELVEALLSILRNGEEPEELRCKAVLSLGPILEEADIDGFDDPEDVPITEDNFLRIRKTLRDLYLDAGVPKDVRRRALEASVRAEDDWHAGAIRAAYAGDDDDWRLTAVFSMRWVRGFDEQILEALGSDNEEIHIEAVYAAGNWELKAAWKHVSGIIGANDVDKPLRLAAMDAALNIRPKEAGELLMDLIDSDDEDIADAAHEAMAMADGLLDEDDDYFMD